MNLEKLQEKKRSLRELCCRKIRRQHREFKEKARKRVIQGGNSIGGKGEECLEGHNSVDDVELSFAAWFLLLV